MNKDTYLLKPILELVADYAKKIEGEEYLTAEGIWELLVFDKDNESLNDSVEIHIPSGIAVKERTIPLDESIQVTAKFLLFDYTAHSPSFELLQYENAAELKKAILSSSGLLNPFCTILLPVINANVYDITTLIKQMKKYEETNSLDIYDPAFELSEKIIELTEEFIADSSSETWTRLFAIGRELIANYKNKGGARQQAYYFVFFAYLLYQYMDEEIGADFIADLLDCICGNTGNIDWHIWEGYVCYP